MQGQLFTQDFLRRGIRDTEPWRALGDDALARFTQALQGVFAGLDAGSALNEAQTEQLIIEPCLLQLGWSDDHLPQVNLSGKRREDVPDMLLFADAAAKARAIAEPRDDKRYAHGLALLEAKRWLRPLDRGDASEPLDPDAPSSQMLRYLSRADVLTDRKLKWGILSNGSTWRLYWQDARSRSEEFFEINLAAALGLAGIAAAPDDPEPAHALKLFFLFFNRAAFLSQTWDSAGRSLHAHARDEARRYEETVSRDLGQRVFNEVYPRLAQALAQGDVYRRRQLVGYGHYTRLQYTAEYLEEVREATLVMLYRLLFLFYAEDRLLLPTHDERYAPYSVRALRERVRDGMDGARAWSSTMPRIWLDLQSVFALVNNGDDEIGMPAYNGGLFDPARAPLLVATRLPDKVMAPIIDALSRRTEDLLHAWINYRDLSVSHLGGIYERLLEYSLVHEVQAAESYHDRPEIDRIHARPASFARKASGSYYTHDDLVRLILRESLGRLVDERVARFEKCLADWARRDSLTPALWDKLEGHAHAGQRDAIDPATQILELTVCDPAMGSGHFLVALVDYLADRVLEAASQASARVNAQPWAAHLVERGRPWESPVIARIAHIRATLRKSAIAHKWSVTDAQLDDRHIVRRMILKKTIFGVDKNPMAVELAKTALWLHTFTVGAPLSFLDHHLKLGDSLHGERLGPVQQDLSALGMLFNQGELDRLSMAARSLAQVADLTDVDIAEARESQRLATEADTRTAPLHALLNFWRALRWLLPGWPVSDARKLAKLGDEALRGALAELIAPGRNLVAVLDAMRERRQALDEAAKAALHAPPGTVITANLPAQDAATGLGQATLALIDQAQALAERESFFHWWTAFPTVFHQDGSGGFDAVIGNPPWDRIKLQEVEWFAEREPRIATQARAADRKRLITELQASKAPLAEDYRAATERAEANARVLAKAGDYPQLGGGDVNLYSLFVERAQALVQPQGIVAVLTPSGIAADKGAMKFFGDVSTTGRLGALYDFENKKVFFADVDSRFKFTTLVFGGTQRRFETTACAFYLHSLDELDEPSRTLSFTQHDFSLVNPNTGAAPIFRAARDAQVTMDIYRRHPVLVRHGSAQGTGAAQAERKVWPVKYTATFHMTNDSGHFVKADELQPQGWRKAAAGRWQRADQQALPLYVGRMIHQFDHRHASVTVNDDNLHNAAGGALLDAAAKANPHALPTPQYWVPREAIAPALWREWALGFRDIARATDARTMIACIIPGVAAGNTLPLLIEEPQNAASASLLLANLNALVFDYVARQKVQSTHLNWYILEQLPVIAAERFNDPLPAAYAAQMRLTGLMNGHHDQPTAADFIVPQVLALSYTAHDLAPFARDLGYVDARGDVLPPLVWEEADRRARQAALDALFMHLYGLDAADAAHVLDSFAIVREQDEAAFGCYRTRDDVLGLLALLRQAVGA